MASMHAGLWALFALVVGTVMAVDLGFLQKKAHVMSVRQAAAMTGLWVFLAVAFGSVIAAVNGREQAMQFMAGYILEQSLSVDNLFVFILIFHYFRIAPEHQPRILHWGILGAIAMRFVFIFAGVSMVESSKLMFYVFGALLLWTGGKMLLSDEDAAPKLHENPALRLLHRWLPVAESPHGQKFFTRINGALHATPLFATLVVVEASDVVFAVDSVPAALGVTSDLFVVYTSNIFAIMGLRSMYFLLAGSMAEFKYLKPGVSFVLCFVGVKMILQNTWHMPTSWSLAVIAGTLSLAIGASLVSGTERRA
jgi:tellurite resistance protein TerC